MKAPSDSYLQQLWRRAVKAVHGEGCILCGAQPVECHHIVKRRHAILRHDWRNGIPLCAACHSKADTISGRAAIGEHVNVEYLQRFEHEIFKGHLKDIGKTRAEFLHAELDELKRVIADPASARWEM